MRFALALLVLAAAPCRAQQGPGVPRADEPQRGSGAYDVGGFGTLALTTGGFSLGGGVRSALSPRVRLVFDAGLGELSDERETRFSGPEGVAIPSKYEYLLVAPLRAGAERRLFARQVEDNVRPFLRLGVGPTVALVRPYFADCNGNRRYERRADCNGDGTAAPGEGEAVLSLTQSLARARPLLGAGATVAAGIHLGRSRRGLQTVGVAVRVDVLPAGVQLLEPDVQGLRRWFITPEAALSLRLF